jgi:hypothetical protein
MFINVYFLFVFSNHSFNTLVLVAISKKDHPGRVTKHSYGKLYSTTGLRFHLAQGDISPNRTGSVSFEHKLNFVCLKKGLGVHIRQIARGLGAIWDRLSCSLQQTFVTSGLNNSYSRKLARLLIRFQRKSRPTSCEFRLGGVQPPSQATTPS